MKRFIFVIFVILVFSMLINLSGLATENKWKETWPKEVRIAAGSVGGGSYMQVSALVNAVKKEFPDASLRIESAKGSVHNIQLIDAKQVEFGTASADTIWEAWNGKGVFKDKEIKSFRLLMPTMPSPYIFVTLKKNNINSLTDLNNKRYGAGVKGGSVAIFLEKVFETFKVNVDYVYLEATDTVLALKNGVIQGFTLGHPAPAIQDLSWTIDTNIFGVTEKEGEKILNSHPELIYPLTIPAGYYKGQDKDVICVGTYQTVIVRDDLPEDFVYSIVKAAYENIDIIKNTWPLMAEGMSLESLKFLSVPLHPGAVKYYKEIGIEIPENLVF